MITIRGRSSLPCGEDEAELEDGILARCEALEVEEGQAPAQQALHHHPPLGAHPLLALLARLQVLERGQKPMERRRCPALQGAGLLLLLFN